jgi:tetratricopeptide (TPR) repeat protein
MKALRGVLAALRTAAVSVMCAGAPFATAAEPRIGKYVEYDAGDFTIVTSRGAAQSQRFMNDLAKFRVTLEKTLRRRATRSVAPTTIVITNRADWEKYLMPRQNVAGFFQQGNFVNYMALNGEAPHEEAVHIVLHEYTHFYLATQFAGEYPPWFNEGLAELMGFAMFKDDGTAVMQIPMYRVEDARRGDWIPFERLIKVSMNDPEYQSHKLSDNFYAQAWLTVHYGFVENRQFGTQITTYLNELNTLHPHEQAARTAFGESLDAVDKQLRAYSRNNRMSSGAIAIGEVPPFALPKGKPVEPVDALAIFADVMLESRVYPGRVRPLVEAMAKREPQAARSAIFAARLALLDQDDKAFDAAVDQAEALLAPTDWLQRRELASVLLTSAQDFSPMSNRTSAQTERDLKRAMKWFGEAVANNPDDVEALWGFGTAATRLRKNLDLAEKALVAANLRAPGSAQIALSLANVMGQQEKPDEMIPYLKDTIRYSDNLETRQWAVEALEQAQKYVADRDRHLAEDKKQREDYEKTLAEYEKKYGKRKRK